MIEVKTILNRNLVQKFNADEIKRKLWFPALLTLLLCGFGIIGWFANLFGGLVAAFLIIVGVLLPVIFWFTAKLMMKRQIESSPVLKSETTQIWRFLDDKIIFNESGKYTQAKDSSYDYDAIYKVVESDTAFYIYLSRVQAYIVDVKGIVIGSRRELHDFLLDRLGSKRVKFPKKIYTKK